MSPWKDPEVRAAYMRVRYCKAKSRGICPRCLKRPKGERSTVFCNTCMDAMAASTKKKHVRRTAAGECRQCGGKIEPWLEGKYCQLCYDKRQERNYISNM